ncbi:MAG TPA: biopolymer transporter ExbD, partial [Paracoccaceae bacterium]|nr:biopolymer transporter ExbD [Paracoccaceae bacterium]
QWRRAEPRRAQIGLTPLIDVVFILLVFFMLASSFLDWRSIQVAGGTTGAARPGLEGALLVEIREDGLRLSGETMTPDALSLRVEARIGKRPDQRIVVRPGAGVDVQRTVAVLDRLTAAGARDVTLAGAP